MDRTINVINKSGRKVSISEEWFKTYGKNMGLTELVENEDLEDLKTKEIKEEVEKYEEEIKTETEEVKEVKPENVCPECGFVARNLFGLRAHIRLGHSKKAEVKEEVVKKKEN